VRPLAFLKHLRKSLAPAGLRILLDACGWPGAFREVSCLLTRTSILINEANITQVADEQVAQISMLLFDHEAASWWFFE
jgi:hypothetical protein